MRVASDKHDSRHNLPFYQLAGSSYLCQLHTLICQQLLGPEAPKWQLGFHQVKPTPCLPWAPGMTWTDYLEISMPANYIGPHWHQSLDQ